MLMTSFIRAKFLSRNCTLRNNHLPLRIPSGLVHHWAGVIFIPNGTIAGVNAVLQDYQNEPSIYMPEIHRAKLIEQNGDESKVFLQLYSKSIITVVLNGYFTLLKGPWEVSAAKAHPTLRESWKL